MASLRTGRESNHVFCLSSMQHPTTHGMARARLMAMRYTMSQQHASRLHSRLFIASRVCVHECGLVWAAAPVVFGASPFDRLFSRASFQPYPTFVRDRRSFRRDLFSFVWTARKATTRFPQPLLLLCFGARAGFNHPCSNTTEPTGRDGNKTNKQSSKQTKGIRVNEARAKVAALRGVTSYSVVLHRDSPDGPGVAWACWSPEYNAM